MLLIFTSYIKSMPSRSSNGRFKSVSKGMTVFKKTYSGSLPFGRTYIYWNQVWISKG